MPGYFFIEITSSLKDGVYTRSFKFNEGEGYGLTWLSVAHYFNRDENYKYNPKLTPEEILKCKECEKKFFAELMADTVDLPDGKHKLVEDKVGDKYRYVVFNTDKHKDW